MRPDTDRVREEVTIDAHDTADTGGIVLCSLSCGYYYFSSKNTLRSLVLTRTAMARTGAW